MSEYRVAYRYAKSLLELAEEKGILEAVHQDMQLFASVAKENRDFVLLLKNPIIPGDKKLSVLEAVFGGKVNELTQEFYKIIVRKGREGYLLAISKEFHLQYNAYKGIAGAKVITTFALNDELRKQFTDIVKEISGKEVELEEMVDEDLLGGFVLRIGDRQVDESVSTKLLRLKKEFSYNPYVKEI